MSLGIGINLALRGGRVRNPLLANLPSYASHLAATLRGDADTTILILDDSTGAGWNASLWPDNMFLGSWPKLMCDILQSLGYPFYYSFASASYPAAVNNRRRDDRWTVSGSPYVSGAGNWTNPGAGGGFGMSWLVQTTGTTPVRFTPGVTAGECDTVDLYWVRLNTGNIEYNLNGGSYQTITTTGSADIHKTTIAIGSSATNHYIEIRQGTADAYIVGVDFYHSTQKRVKVFNGSIPSAQFNKFATTTNNWTENAMIDAIQPDLVIAGGGINEYFQSSASSATVLGYHTTVRGQLAAMASDPDYLIKSMVPSDESAKAGIVAAQLDLRSEYQDYAATNSLGYIDLYGQFGGGYQASLMSDTLHPNDAGYTKMAKIMANAIRP